MVNRVLFALLATAGAAGVHPIHTSVAELGYDETARVATVAIRVYPDDLAGAVPGRDQAVGDAALRQYVLGRFALVDRLGRPVHLEWVGVERVADALLIRLRGKLPEGLGEARVAHLLLHDRFGDQVNVVRARYGRRTATLLFLPGDGPKRLP